MNFKILINFCLCLKKIIKDVFFEFIEIVCYEFIRMYVFVSMGI